MEIEVHRRFVIITGALLVLLLLTWVGMAVSPREATGRWLLLTPQRRAVLQYLRWCQHWTDSLVRLQDDLDALTLADSQSAASATDLYRRAQRAQKALETALDLQRDAERVRVPAPMVGVHQLVTASAQAFPAWAEAVTA
ncbi:hypothetical protein, partial [Thermogutta sp.]|uniref:hypothetical protein n=1 Tax=Thermogutta sp. TaxID=1962930 RepID=UPI0032209204